MITKQKNELRGNLKQKFPTQMERSTAQGHQLNDKQLSYFCLNIYMINMHFLM